MNKPKTNVRTIVDAADPLSGYTDADHDRALAALMDDLAALQDEPYDGVPQDAIGG